MPVRSSLLTSWRYDSSTSAVAVRVHSITGLLTRKRDVGVRLGLNSKNHMSHTKFSIITAAEKLSNFSRTAYRYLSFLLEAVIREG